MVIKINYTSSDVYVSTSVSPVYVVVNYSGVSTGGGVWGQITGTLSNQTDLQNALDAKFDDPTGTTSQYLRGDGSLATFPSLTGYVPYTGATQDVDLGEFELKAGQVEFDQTPTGTAGVAVMRWNDSDGTVDLGLKGGNVTLQVGQEQILRVVNKTGANLLESQYRAVRIRLAAEGGSQGQRLAVVLAQGNNDTNSTDTIGIVTENITDNQEGFICTSGIVRGINTTGSLQGETWADGDVIYLSPTIPGAITKVKPTAPDHSVVLGYVIYAHNVNGKIFVKCETGYEIGELHDVYAPTPSNNDGIFWNTANSRYQNNSIAGVLGYTPISGSGVTGQVAYWNGTNSQTGSNNLFWDSANSRLGIGTNSPSYNLHNVGTSAFDQGASGDAITILNGGFISMASTRFRATSTQFQFQDNAYNNKVIINTTATISYFNTGGNYAFGKTTDSGQRLQVQGNAIITTTSQLTAISSTGGLFISNSSTSANGVIGLTGAGFILQGKDGASTSYPLLLQPYGSNVGIGTTSPSASAILQADSTTRGFLPPRMTNAQRAAISSPAVGLLVYQTDATEGTYEYISSGWRIINGGGGGGSVDELQVALISQVFG